MSIYNAIANSGSNLGPQIANAFATRHQLGRERMLDQEAQEDRAYAKNRNALVDQQFDEQRKLDIFNQHVDYFAGGMSMDKVMSSLSSQGYGQADPSIPEKIQAIAQSRAPQAAPPKTRWTPNPDGSKVRERWDQGAASWVQDSDPVPRLAPTTNVNVEMGDSSRDALGEALVKDQAGEFSLIQERGRNARGMLQQLQVARSIDVRTNPGESYRVAAQKIAGAFGVPVDDEQISNADAFVAVMGRIVNDRISQEKGPQTDQDVIRFKKTMAGLDNPEQAKDFLLGYSEALAMRDIDQANYFREGVKAVQRGETDYEELRDAWDSYLDDTPLLRVMTNNETGVSAPMFYHQFEREMKARNPGISQKQIMKVWTSGNK